MTVVDGEEAKKMHDDMQRLLEDRLSELDGKVEGGKARYEEAKGLIDKVKGTGSATFDDLAEPQEILESLRAADPTNYALLLTAGELLYMMGSFCSKTFEDRTGKERSVTINLGTSSFNRAANAFQEALSAAPNRPELAPFDTMAIASIGGAYTDLGFMLKKLEETDEVPSDICIDSSSLLEQAYKVYQDVSGPLPVSMVIKAKYDQARILLALDMDAGKALHFLRNVSKLSPGYADSEKLIVEAKEKSGARSEVRIKNPDLMDELRTAYSQGDTGETLRLCKQYLEQEGLGQLEIHSIGQIFYDIGRYEEGIAAFERAIETGGPQIPTRMAMVYAGLCYKKVAESVEQTDREAASKHYEKAKALINKGTTGECEVETSLTGLIQLIDCHIELGEVGEAIDLGNMLVQHPNFARATDEMREIHGVYMAKALRAASGGE